MFWYTLCLLNMLHCVSVHNMSAGHVALCFGTQYVWLDMLHSDLVHNMFVGHAALCFGTHYVAGHAA